MRGCGCRSCVTVDFGSSGCAPRPPRGEVAHIGCTDSPYTEERLAAEVLLHQRLVKLAPVTSFDVDGDALELLSRGLPHERSSWQT